LCKERLPGSPPSAVTPTVIDAIIQLNERFAHVLHDRPDVPLLSLCLTVSGDPYPRHEVLAAHSDRSRRVLEAIQAIGARTPKSWLEMISARRPYFVQHSLRTRPERLPGVVDWNLGGLSR